MSIARGGLASALIASCALASAAQPAGAAVVCQKGKLIKLRADACKPGFTTLATIGGAGDPSGTWEFQDGTLLQFPGFVPRVLSLEPNGSGALNAALGEAGVLDCEAFNYVRGETPTLMLAVGSFVESSVPVLRFSLTGQDELDLVGAAGQTAKLARIDHADPADDCPLAQEVTLFTDLPQPDGTTGLAFDGNQLWYTVENKDQIVPVDPASGAAGTPVDFGTDGFTHIHASAGADFWAHCNCGSNDEVARIHGGNTVADLVQTDDELHLETSVESIAFDPPTGTLWLSGFDENDDRGVLLQVDPSGEPDVLVQTFDVGTGFVGLAFDGTNLWGLQFGGQSLTRIDPTTGQATGNFTIPTHVAFWQGVAVVGDELVLLGDTGIGGAILKLQLPADVGHAARARIAPRAHGGSSGGSRRMRQLMQRRGPDRRTARADAQAK